MNRVFTLTKTFLDIVQTQRNLPFYSREKHHWFPFTINSKRDEKDTKCWFLGCYKLWVDGEKNQ